MAHYRRNRSYNKPKKRAGASQRRREALYVDLEEEMAHIEELERRCVEEAPGRGELPFPNALRSSNAELRRENEEGAQREAAAAAAAW